MPFKPNYRFERIERERKKQAKKDEKKLKRQQERSAGELASSPQENSEEGSPQEN